MILRTASGRNRELRDMFSGVDVVPLPSQALGNWSVAGRRVTPDRAASLPAMLRGIRFLAEGIAALPLIVYRGDPATPTSQAVVQHGSQFSILHDVPNGLQTPFDFMAYIVASLIGYGNAYLLKSKVDGKVLELWPLDPTRVTPKVNKDGTDMTYKVRVKPNDAVTVKMDRGDLIHIRGTLLNKDPYIGVSPILVAANAVGGALAAEEFAGRFYANDATPAGVIEFARGANTQEAKDTREAWEDRHRGAKNAHRVGVLFGGAKYQQIGISAEAAQIVQAQQWNVQVTANVLGLPVWALGGADPNPRSTPEQRNTGLLQFSFAPWLVRIEQALWRDDDLFPSKRLAPRFLADGMLRADMSLRYAAYLQGRQAGWLSVNDIRVAENQPPIEGGDTYQDTPVGGAPNLQPAGEGDGSTVEPAGPST